MRQLVICVLLSILLYTPTHAQFTYPKDVAGLISSVENYGEVQDGHLFVSVIENLNRPTYNIILDKHGDLVYWNKGTAAIDFHPIRNNTELIYFDGQQGGYVILDNQYQQIGLIKSLSPYTTTDFHELLWTDEDTWIVLIHPQRQMDLSVFGGQPNSTVTHSSLQEVTGLYKSNQLIFNWDAFDHFTVDQSYWDLNSTAVRASHVNSVEIMPDGHFLLSARTMSALIKIHRITGEVLWVMGGKLNQFNIDSNFVWQHDARWLDGNKLSIFDNGVDNIREQSRAVIYTVDEDNKLATLEWEYWGGPERYARATGSTQVLDNGNVLIGWGTSGYIDEVTPDKEVVQTIKLKENHFIYRAVKHNWESEPEYPPTLVHHNDTLYFSHNGNTNIGGWYIYGSINGNSYTLISVVPHREFEEWVNISKTRVDNDMCFYQVRPFSLGGFPGPISSKVHACDQYKYMFPTLFGNSP